MFSSSNSSQAAAMLHTSTNPSLKVELRYFTSRLSSLHALLMAIKEEIQAYKQFIAKFDELVRNPNPGIEEKRFLRKAYHIRCEWNEKSHATMAALTTMIDKYLKERLLTQIASLEEETQQYIVARINELIVLNKSIINDLPKSTQQPIIINFDDIAEEDSQEDDHDEIIKAIVFHRANRIECCEAFIQARIAAEPSDKGKENFKDCIYDGAKSGGANLSGELGGWYHDKTNPRKRSLIKKEDAIEKVMGEYLAGNILGAIYTKLRVLPSQYAKVSLIRPLGAPADDKSGQDVYLKSDAIPNYKGDLWDFAWDDALLNSKTKVKKPSERPRFRPAKSIKLTDLFIQDSKLSDEFARLAAPRLLLADFGLHNGNFGVTEDNGEFPHLAALDYGAAFNNLSAKMQPYALPSSITEFYKNHFLDYSKEINASTAMAKTFIKIGNMDPSVIHIALDKGLEKICELYDTPALLKFCKRLGMSDCGFNSESDVQVVKEAITTFIKVQIASRQKSLKEQGYALLLEHCVTQNLDGEIEVDKVKLRALLQHYKVDLSAYIASEAFENYHLVYHKALTGVAALAHNYGAGLFMTRIRRSTDNPIKEAVRDATGLILSEASSSQSSSSDIEVSPIYRTKRSFLSRNFRAIIAVTALWAITGAGISLIASGGLLTIPALIVGGLFGFVIGIGACAIRECALTCTSPEAVPTSTYGDLSEPLNIGSAKRTPTDSSLINTTPATSPTILRSPTRHGLYPAPGAKPANAEEKKEKKRYEKKGK